MHAFSRLKSLACNYFPGFYACAVWSVTVCEEHTVRVAENRMQRRIFQRKNEAMPRIWRGLNSVELHIRNSSNKELSLYDAAYIRRKGRTSLGLLTETSMFTAS